MACKQLCNLWHASSYATYGMHAAMQPTACKQSLASNYASYGMQQLCKQWHASSYVSCGMKAAMQTMACKQLCKLWHKEAMQAMAWKQPCRLWHASSQASSHARSHASSHENCGLMNTLALWWTHKQLLQASYGMQRNLLHLQLSVSFKKDGLFADAQAAIQVILQLIL